jgi:hypothetical protein
MKKLIFLLLVGLGSLSSCTVSYESRSFQPTPPCSQSTYSSGGYTTGYAPYPTSSVGVQYQNTTSGSNCSSCHPQQQVRQNTGPRRQPKQQPVLIQRTRKK